MYVAPHNSNHVVHTEVPGGAPRPWVINLNPQVYAHSSRTLRCSTSATPASAYPSLGPTQYLTASLPEKVLVRLAAQPGSGRIAKMEP